MDKNVFLSFHVFTYIFEKNILFLQENNKDIFIKMRIKIDEIKFSKFCFQKVF